MKPSMHHRAKLAKLDSGKTARPALQLAEANKKVIATLEKRLQLETADPRAPVHSGGNR
ncbi:MAG: hypothetical protein U1E36_02380 [Rickettsiales bacterium]